MYIGKTDYLSIQISQPLVKLQTKRAQSHLLTSSVTNWLTLVSVRFQQEENNNNIPNPQTEQTSSLHQSKSAQMLLEMRTAARKFNIAAANPLLAEKLSTPSGQLAQQVAAHGYNGRQTAALKVEKGMYTISFHTFS